MSTHKPEVKKVRKLNFLNLILFPFFVITLFSAIYANNFMLAFLIDSKEAIELARKEGVGTSEQIEKLLNEAQAQVQPFSGKVEVTMKDGSTDTRVSGSIIAFLLRIIFLVLLYIWVKPLLNFFRNHNSEIKARAEKRYNNFYIAIFSYIVLTHSIMFASSLIHLSLSALNWQRLAYHLVLVIVECYLFYLFLEPTLFLYVSNYFTNFGGSNKARSSLSIYAKLISMLVFLVIVPMAIIAAFAYKDCLILDLYQSNTILLIVTSLAFLIGNTQLLYKSIQEPLDFLVDKMQRLASGDFSIKTSVLFDDEIGKLKTNFNLMVEQLKEREELRDTFGKYVSIEVARHLIENNKVDLGGETIEATVLFSDIRNFTSMSEQMSPEEVVNMLNTYFAYITEPISENHGVINKFIGDAVMAIFAPHLGSENHVEDAIKASLSMRKKLKDLNKSQKLKLPIKSGIGLNTGTLVAGNIGTEKRFEYTVIGDTVNVASRMESLSKDLNTDIVISENTLQKVKHEFFNQIAVEKCDPVKIKGKSELMQVYKLL
jgi:class 3 adenylate cyclase